MFFMASEGHSVWWWHIKQIFYIWHICSCVSIEATVDMILAVGYSIDFPYFWGFHFHIYLEYQSCLIFIVTCQIFCSFDFNFYCPVYSLVSPIFCNFDCNFSVRIQSATFALYVSRDNDQIFGILEFKFSLFYVFLRTNLNVYCRISS